MDCLWLHRGGTCGGWEAHSDRGWRDALEDRGLGQPAGHVSKRYRPNDTSGTGKRVWLQ